MPARTAKQQGELAEVAFIYRASALGFVVSKPFGDSAPFDVVVGSGPRLFRVQVKSAAGSRNGVYEINAGRGRFVKSAYTANEIDVLAAWLVPEDVWYLIPVAAFSPRKTIRLGNGAGRRYARFREDWG